MNDEKRIDTDELEPLEVGGKIQWGAVARWWTRNDRTVIAAIVSTVTALATGIPIMRAKLEEAHEATRNQVRSVQKDTDETKKLSDAGWTLLVPRIIRLEDEIHTLQEAAALREKKGHAARKPIPVVVLPKPKPLPPSLKAAEREVNKPGPPPVVIPLPPKTSDAAP